MRLLLYNKKVKEKCRELRKQGKSFREIASLLKLPPATVFLWAKTVDISQEDKVKLHKKSLDSLQQGRLLAQTAKKQKYNQEVECNLNLGKQRIGKCFTKRELDCIGVALYWAEGFKKDHRLGFANSDPIMIKLFLFWLEESLGVPKSEIRLRVGINKLFEDRIKEIEQYWSDTTGIPLNQFQKPFYQNSKLNRLYPNHKTYFGVLRIRANGQRKTFEVILGMIEGMKGGVARII